MTNRLMTNDNVKVKKIYFFSDIHFGLPNAEKSRQREKRLVKCLDEIKKDAEAVFFVGDIFDFWWEYKYVVPRGYTRFFGKIAEMTDAGIDIHFFAGNHDVWMKNYLPEELGIILHHREFEPVFNNHKFYIAHGDGLGPNDRTYKLLKKVFTNKTLQWLFALLHPRMAFGLAYFWSQSRRKKEKTFRFAGRNKEQLLLHAENLIKHQDINYFVFGHRHIPYILPLSEKSICANIGNWLAHFTFLVFDGNEMQIKTYQNDCIENFTMNLETEYRMNVFEQTGRG